MLTQDNLKEVLDYNTKTGVFIWKKKTNKYAPITIGAVAGGLTNDGYLQLRVYSKLYLLHRLAFLYMTGIMPEFIDHIDGNKCNNSWDNLRECSKAENNYNRVANKNSSSGIKGISFITYDGYLYAKARVAHERRIHVKLFRYTDVATKLKAEEQAITWLENKREQLHKEFTNHG